MLKYSRVISEVILQQYLRGDANVNVLLCKADIEASNRDPVHEVLMIDIDEVLISFFRKDFRIS